MIDYNKLKIAHELAEKFYNNDNNYVIYTRFSAPHLTFKLAHNHHRLEFEYIDDLIAKLKELTHPEPKYKTAWYVLDGRIKSTEVLNQEGYVYCDKTAIEAVGRTMYTSREELIQAQIEYWKKLKQENCEHDFNCFKLSDSGPPICCCCKCSKDKSDINSNQDKVDIDSCQHESDGAHYCTNPSTYETKYKCKKCGEFFR